MFQDKEIFKSEYRTLVKQEYGKPLERCGSMEKYKALCMLISRAAGETRAKTWEKYEKNQKKAVYYFSMEFLMGRLLKNYLLNFGIFDIIEDGLKDLDIDLDELCQNEAEPGLGNGGLGRLAACFLDSMAFLGINATGMGIRYRFGLFRQHIVSGWQKEEPDAWLNDEYPWETRHADDAVLVRFGGNIEPEESGFKYMGYNIVKAVPYDVPIVGYGGEIVNSLRLWSAEAERDDLDLDAFNKGDYCDSVKGRSDAEAISCILYPDDSTEAGKILRLKQEYFFVCAGLTSILRKYKLEFGDGQWDKFPDRVSIHTNDTHPALCVPELMRLLMDGEGLKWDAAWDIVTRSVSYTNHTVLPEALEKWPISMYSRLLPRIFMITEEIDRRYRAGFPENIADRDAKMNATAVIGGGQVHMANLSVIGSHSVNGVAALHTEILKADTLKDFYVLTPEKFNNKTNGVSHRRFMVESNPGLVALVSEAMGGTSWINDPMELEGLLRYTEDRGFLDSLRRVKRENKCRLADYIFKKNHIKVDPDSIFDVQVKRIHAYKRQHLGVMKILDIYNRLKQNPNTDFVPHTFIFAGKAAQSYVFAKQMIKFICSAADIINSDPEMDGKMKVVFLENFAVSSGQIIYPGSDISEQISTAGKEASGTGNMKFMMNGALTLGTMDGANVEINHLVGDENMRIFGLRAEEAAALRRHGYTAANEHLHDEGLKAVVDQLYNGFFECCGVSFADMYREMIAHNDEFFVLKDFRSYVNAWEAMSRDYRDTEKWARMSLINIAKSGWFSSDRTIREYASEIWKA